MIVPETRVEANHSPLKCLSEISLGMHRGSIPSPTKVLVSLPGNLSIQSPGFFKTCYNYKLPSNFVEVSEKTMLERTVCEQGETSCCRICLGTDKVQTLISPCSCAGSLKYVHEECLKKWILSKDAENLSVCELCQTHFKMEFEVSSRCLPFNCEKSCKPWGYSIATFFLLFSVVFLCFITVKSGDSSVALIVGALFLAFFFVGCCLKSVFSALSLCFERNIESWKIDNSQSVHI